MWKMDRVKKGTEKTAHMSPGLKEISLPNPQKLRLSWAHTVTYSIQQSRLIRESIAPYPPRFLL